MRLTADTLDRRLFHASGQLQVGAGRVLQRDGADVRRCRVEGQIARYILEETVHGQRVRELEINPSSVLLLQVVRRVVDFGDVAIRAALNQAAQAGRAGVAKIDDGLGGEG